MNKDSLYLLQDAFVHIIRNSLDHGVENPEERKQKGKNNDTYDDDFEFILRS